MRCERTGENSRNLKTKSVKCGKFTVGKMQKRCRNYKLQYDAAAIMTNDEIKALLYPIRMIV